MRICFVCDEYPPSRHGGIGVFTRVLARGLTAAGDEVRVAGCYPGSRREPDYEEDQGVRVWRQRTPNVRGGFVWARGRLFRLLRSWAKRGEVDLIEVPDYSGYAAYWPALPVPVVSRLHGSKTYFAIELGEPVDWKARWIECASLRRSDSLVSTSRYTLDRTVEAFALAGMPAEVIYNFAELPPPFGENCRKPYRVVFSGTLVPKKGIVSLIRAWPDVRRRCAHAVLDVYGKDATAKTGESMRRRIESMLDPEMRPSVRFHGHVTHDVLIDALRRAACCVLPSYAEAFSLAPIEAMSVGCPTVFSRRTSGPELIENGRSGLLVDPDRPDEIADAIIRLLRNAEFASRLGLAGMERVRRHFSKQTQLAANRDYFQRCIETFGSERRRYGRVAHESVA
ncbi:MAG: glycosyltransferase family 4 protein [Bryobacteraceae bacterium]